MHLEAMADESVREWLALPTLDPNAVGFAKQIARIEHYHFDYLAWRRSMGLPDTDETSLIHRRISWIWLRATAESDFEDRMAYARKTFRLELGEGDET